MLSGQNKIDNKFYGQFLIMQDSVNTNKKFTGELNQDNDELKRKLNKHDSDLYEIKTLIKKVLVQNQN